MIEVEPSGAARDATKVTRVRAHCNTRLPRVHEKLVKTRDEACGNAAAREIVATGKPADGYKFAIMIRREVIAGFEVSVVCHLSMLVPDSVSQNTEALDEQHSGRPYRPDALVIAVDETDARTLVCAVSVNSSYPDTKLRRNTLVVAIVRKAVEHIVLPSMLGHHFLVDSHPPCLLRQPPILHFSQRMTT